MPGLVDDLESCVLMLRALRQGSGGAILSPEHVALAESAMVRAARRIESQDRQLDPRRVVFHPRQSKISEPR